MMRICKKHLMRGLLATCFAGFINQACHADDAMVPEAVAAIVHQSGQRMVAAGFDQAGQIRSRDNWLYDPKLDTMMVGSLELAWENNPARHRHADADQITTFAGHEHCHAYLWKHHARLPAAVQQAQDACDVEPSFIFGRLFDELFCDVAPIAVFGETAQQIMLDARDDPSFIEYFGKDRARLLRAAVAALPRDAADPVTATANAVATSCSNPELQAKRGQREQELATDIALELAKFLHLPSSQISPPVIVPMRDWPADERQRFESVRSGSGELPILAIQGAYETCLRAAATPQRRDAPDARRAREKCQLTTEAYDQAFCTALSMRIARTAAQRWSSDPERDLIVMRFGKHSLPAKTLEEASSFMLGANAEEYSLAMESACGATVPELASWERVAN